MPRAIFLNYKVDTPATIAEKNTIHDLRAFVHHAGILAFSEKVDADTGAHLFTFVVADRFIEFCTNKVLSLVRTSNGDEFYFKPVKLKKEKIDIAALQDSENPLGLIDAEKLPEEEPGFDGPVHLVEDTNAVGLGTHQMGHLVSK